MYNHYIPQSDGSFRRSSVPDQNRRPQKPSPPPPPPKPPEQPKPPEPQKQEPTPPPVHEAPCRQAQPQSPLSFLKKLLPKDIDTADLIIIAILLLIGVEEDCDDLAPLLTIALYFLL